MKGCLPFKILFCSVNGQLHTENLHIAPEHDSLKLASQNSEEP